MRINQSERRKGDIREDTALASNRRRFKSYYIFIFGCFLLLDVTVQFPDGLHRWFHPP